MKLLNGNEFTKHRRILVPTRKRETNIPKMSLKGSRQVDLNDEGHLSQPPKSLKISPEAPQVMLITANVGSIFEEPDQLIPQWLSHVFAAIDLQSAKFVAIHLQEIGGKNFQKTMDQVNNFVNKIVMNAEVLGFDRVVAFFDENYQAVDRFTALGSVYLIHKTLPEVEIFNFQTLKFQATTHHMLHLGCIEEVALLEKNKFPLQYFPDSRWSRKGFLRTRWRIGAETHTSFDLVNIHLFHDACNLKSVEAEGPSIYVTFREKALQYTLDKISENSEPFFVFGDFNFRLNCRSVVDALNAELRVKNDDVDDDVDSDDSGDGSDSTTRKCVTNEADENEENVRPVLSIGKKEFNLGMRHHDKTFFKEWKRWTEFDLETRAVRDRVTEFPLNFPPTYPFEEDLKEGKSYMKTRCPAWCDRVLLSHEAADNLIKRSEPQNGFVTSSSDTVYDIIGADVCMGDHKPVFLSFRLSPTISSPSKTLPHRDVIERELPPSIESPSYTDLLGSTLYSRYIEIRENSAPLKIFKETTV